MGGVDFYDFVLEVQIYKILYGRYMKIYNTLYRMYKFINLCTEDIDL